MRVTRLLAIGLAVAVSGTALGQTVPDRISFSARMTDTAGNPVSGANSVVFSLFAGATGGSSVWTETYGSLMFTTDGLAYAELGTNTPLTATIFNGAKLYLEVSVNGTAMSPRIGVVSVPYAIRASVADRVGGLSASDLGSGHTASSAGASCNDIKQRNPGAADGLYLIDTDGAGVNPPFEVYCDMTRDGGGWTLIMRVWYQSGMAGRAGGFGSPHEAYSPRGEPYKLADATVQAIIGTDNNFDILVDQLFHNTMYSSGNHEYIVVRNYTGLYTYTAAVPESTTPTVFESYRSVDNAIAWRGRLQCGQAGTGINCNPLLTAPNPLGAPNPQGGLGCLLNLGAASNAGWHDLAQGAPNTDTYIYICNGAQHTSSFSNVHRWWVR